MEYSQKDKDNAVAQLSKKIIDNVYSTILIEMRFLDVALARLMPEPSDEVLYLGTDGKNLHYNPKKLINEYKTNPSKVAHDVLHTVLHCVFLHIFDFKSEQFLFNLACDISVEQVISTINIPIINCIDNVKLGIIDKFEKHIEHFTPVSVMRFIKESDSTQEELEQLADLFFVDNHRYWVSGPGLPGEGEGEGEGESDNDSNGFSFDQMASNQAAQEQLKKIWENVGNTMELNMESFSKLQGDKAGNFRQKLKHLNREKYDYSSFLRKFSTLQEVTKVNNDEFDYIPYTYGLSQHNNMPFIEPLEYKDSYVIRDFVIAIDTSGSTSGEVVQTFLQKTYNILKSSESFASKVNICLIQCDALIQDIVHINSIDEFDEYIANFEIKGGGGTDFRPVFALVNEMVNKKVFNNLKGLIYFTDGYGTFPAQKTKYDTAFIFIVKEDYDNVTVPPWAIKILLTENEIKEFKLNM